MTSRETAPAPVARVAGLSYAYARDEGSGEPLPVLRDVDMEVAPGELVAIIGPSGCGKTTLLRLFAGLAPARAATGVVEVSGRPVKGPSPEIGYVFQHVGLVPWRTVRANVEFGLQLRRHRRLRAEEKQRVQEVIDLVGMNGFEDYHPNRLSGGMQQRVGMARALATDPELLLLDEPFGALDAQSRRLFQDELLRWRRDRSYSALLVTHDLDEAIYLADRVVVMSARPARIVDQFVVDLPGRAVGQEVRGLDGYSELYAKLWDLLLEENLRGREDAS